MSRLSKVLLVLSHGPALFLRVVHDVPAKCFRVEKYRPMRRDVFEPEFPTLDEALAYVAEYAPGHACSAFALALLPASLNPRNPARATLAGAPCFYSTTAGMWIGENLRDLAAAAVRAYGLSGVAAEK